MIHLYAPPGDFPDTLCGLTQNWCNRHAVYGRDFHRVDCPDCLAKLQMPPREFHERTPRESDPVYLLLKCGAGILALLVIVWRWLP